MYNFYAFAKSITCTYRWTIELFKDKEKISYSQLMHFLAETMGVTDRMAKNYILFMQEHGIIEHPPIGKDYQQCQT